MDNTYKSLMEDFQVLAYLAKKSGDFSIVIEKALGALIEWQKYGKISARNITLLALQISIETAKPINDSILEDLKAGLNLEQNLSLLEGCTQPTVVGAELFDHLWAELGQNESAATVELISKVIVSQFPALKNDKGRLIRWWPSIKLALAKDWDKRFVTAGLKSWVACVTYLSEEDINLAIMSDSTDYFRILQVHVASASKFSLQILRSSLATIHTRINSPFMTYDPAESGTVDSWNRYVSLVEIIGVDTSIHQTMDSLPDFAALLAPTSLIPQNWMITLITVGAVNSNTEGIRTLVIQLILEASSSQLRTLAGNPIFLANVLYPRFLQTPSFVFVNGRCLHAERLERFTKAVTRALVQWDDENVSVGVPSHLQQFVGELAKFFLEHAHGFEAPRVLIIEAMRQSIPPRSLCLAEANQLLAAAKSTLATYTSRTMADLYLTKVTELVTYAGPVSLKLTEETEIELYSAAKAQLSVSKFLERQLFVGLKEMCADEMTFGLPLATGGQMAPKQCSTLLDILGPLQYSVLFGRDKFPLKEHAVMELLEDTLQNPAAMVASDRKFLSEAVELAFDHLEKGCTFELCELAFAAFNETPTRYAALRAFKRSQPRDISSNYVTALWRHLQEVTLRIIDRHLHHEFIDLLTQPGVIKADEWEQQQEICLELVEMSLTRHNLLVPLATGLQRFASHSVQGSGAEWVMLVMSRIFAFIRSKEYTLKLNEQLATRFNIYEKYWGAPDSRARGIAAVYLASNESGAEATAAYALSRAELDVKITGSLDNVEAHRRVLYFQILIMLQDRLSEATALDIRDQIRSSLETEANPPVRVHAEWLIGLISSTHQSKSSFSRFVLRSIEELDSKTGIPPRIRGSLIRITMLLYHASNKRAPEAYEKIGETLIEHLLPLATSNKAVIRHRAISALWILHKRGMAPKSMQDMVKRISEGSDAGVMNSKYQNETYLWDVLDTRLSLVCGGVSNKVFGREMPNTLTLADFELAHPLLWGAYGETIDLGPFEDELAEPAAEPTLPESVAYREAIVREAVATPMESKFSTQIQTKSGTFDVGVARRTSLVVVATLCDKPVNLGAITRLSDALGVNKLCMADTSVLDDQQYKTTALTAEKWIPIEQVTVSSLESFLRFKKSEGFTIVGIEQTDTSKMLTKHLQFPEKTLLVMGHERKGIPAEILNILDVCVEIEQLGYVRSMNIQTATAIVVQAYNQNHSSKVSSVQYEH